MCPIDEKYSDRNNFSCSRLYCLGWIERFLKKYEWGRRFFNWLWAHIKKDNREEKIRKYGPIGLIPFVAIPLPVTGAWTGSLLAYLLNLDKFKAFLYICSGVAIAGLIVLGVVAGVIKGFEFFTA
jgi:uncharacterized membrane protein